MLTLKNLFLRNKIKKNLQNKFQDTITFTHKIMLDMLNFQILIKKYNLLFNKTSVLRHGYTNKYVVYNIHTNNTQGHANCGEMGSKDLNET